MALKHRKSRLGDLWKLFNKEKEPDIPAVPTEKPVDIPINALRISHYGVVQQQQLTFFNRTDKTFLIGNHYYYVPLCMQAPGKTELDPAIRRFTWVFKKEFASKSTAAKQKTFTGAYSVWYKDMGTSARPKALSQIDGDFWLMKQRQIEPEPGETVEWEHLPKDLVAELNNDWWFMAVQLPDIDAAAKPRAPSPKERSSGPSSC